MTPNLPSGVVVARSVRTTSPVEVVTVYVRATPTPDTRLREALLSIIREAEEVTEAQHGTPHGALYAIIRRAREALDATREETT